MEALLDVYELPYDPDYPVVCMDESSKQLVGEVTAPIPGKPGETKRIDDEYVRFGVSQLFIEVEPLTGRRHVVATERRTKIDWALQIQAMLDQRYPEAKKVRLVMDNLNTHNISSLYEAFEPAEAHRLAGRLELHFTPKHGSWLNMAEIEFSALKLQCLNRRIADAETLKKEIAAWEIDRNNSAKHICWQFTTPDARTKLRKLYPNIKVLQGLVILDQDNELVSFTTGSATEWRVEVAIWGPVAKENTYNVYTNTFSYNVTWE